MRSSACALAVRDPRTRAARDPLLSQLLCLLHSVLLSRLRGQLCSQLRSQLRSPLSSSLGPLLRLNPGTRVHQRSSSATIFPLQSSFLMQGVIQIPNHSRSPSFAPFVTVQLVVRFVVFVSL